MIIAFIVLCIVTAVILFVVLKSTSAIVESPDEPISIEEDQTIINEYSEIEKTT